MTFVSGKQELSLQGQFCRSGAFAAVNSRLTTQLRNESTKTLGAMTA
jgi:hypothetical protein